MAGIYLHIPFCKQACVYCDFHFSTLSKDRETMPKALIREAKLRKDYLEGEMVHSIYFGGGTPSLLPVAQIQEIIDALKALFTISDTAEISLEANPDDLSESYLEALSASAVNRLSIGIQSFKQSDLDFMNRAHTVEEARFSLKALKRYGFDNYTIDLIYGLPGQSDADWRWQLQQLAEYQVPHFSAYALTVEEKTKLAHLQNKGEVKVEEECAARHFAILQDEVEKLGYEHYELSNFARPGHRAVHNSAYWQAKPYLGLGPSAHSYNGTARAWNLANNKLYLTALEKDQLALSEEQLTEVDRFNEWLMTSLRLKEGISEAKLRTYQAELQDHALKEIGRIEERGQLKKREDAWFIPKEWRFHSDGIAAELFFV